MQLYAAPLEGITGYVFRNAFCKCFDNVDKYFIPFIQPNQKGHFSSREKQDVKPENNQGMYAVPQILTNLPEDFLRTAWKLQTAYGYREINLNLGCPSKTVISKKRGSGFLAYPDELERFLEEIFDKAEVEISIKTRIGKESPDEFANIIEIYNRFPVKELIIHPRVQTDFYKNSPNLDVFQAAMESAKMPVCYNGDIFSIEDYERFTERFPQVDRIMLGRGLLKNPGLTRQIRQQIVLDKETLKQFHDYLYEGYCQVLSGDRTILFKMKELWGFLAPAFTSYEKYAKKIKKAEKLWVYEEIVEKLFMEQQLIVDKKDMNY